MPLAIQKSIPPQLQTRVLFRFKTDPVSIRELLRVVELPQDRSALSYTALPLFLFPQSDEATISRG